MAHFARIDDTDTVCQVLAVSNAALDDLPYPESEPVGQALLAESGFAGTYLQCSYSASFRGMYPADGFRYDRQNDVFVPPGIENLTEK